MSSHTEEHFDEDDEYNIVFDGPTPSAPQPTHPPSKLQSQPKSLPLPSFDSNKDANNPTTSTTTPTSTNPPKPIAAPSTTSQQPQYSQFNQQTSTLPPPDESLYELDLNTLQDKPWRRPGADITDYFNFGFNEESWQVYCQKQLEIKRATKRLKMTASTTQPTSSFPQQTQSTQSTQSMSNFQQQQSTQPTQPPPRPMQNTSTTRNTSGLTAVTHSGLQPIGSFPLPPPAPPSNDKDNIPILTGSQRNFKPPPPPSTHDDAHSNRDRSGRQYL